MPSKAIQPVALDRAQAASFLSLSVGTIGNLERDGEFPKPRLMSGRRVAFLVRELVEWAEARPVADLLPPKNSGYGRAGKPA